MTSRNKKKTPSRTDTKSATHASLPWTGIMAALACLHALLFVVFAALLGQAQGHSGRAFGAPESADTLPTLETQGPTPFSGWLFVGFTLALWLAWFLGISKDEGRVRRFIAMMLAPGTLMAVYLLIAVCLGIGAE